MTPQSLLTIFGVIMLTVSAVGFSADAPADTAPPPASRSSQLKVEPSSGQPDPSLINRLQGAGSLQNQQGQGLQRPVGDQLQPNAKTDSLTPANGVQ